MVIFRRLLVVIGIALLISWNSSRLQVASTGLGGAKTRNNIAKGGYARFASGGSVTTAAALQGANQCVSKFKTDTANAQCQPFCSDKFKKFHCAWCKCVALNCLEIGPRACLMIRCILTYLSAYCCERRCRACDFCPKGGEAIEEAAKDAPPPFSPPPPAAASPSTTTDNGTVTGDMTGDVDGLLLASAANGSESSSSTPLVPDAANASAPLPVSTFDPPTLSFHTGNGTTTAAGGEVSLNATAKGEQMSTPLDASNSSTFVNVDTDGTDYDDDDDPDGTEDATEDASVAAASSSEAERPVDPYDQVDVTKGDGSSVSELQKVA